MVSQQKIVLVLPLQLFDCRQWPLDKQDIKTVYIIEESYYFTRLPFHKQKLAYQRASMKHYQIELQDQLSSVSVKYVNTQDINKQWYQQINNKYGSQIVYFDPIDKQVQILLNKCLPNAQVIPTLNFWLSIEEMQLFKRKSRYHFDSLYQYQKSKLIGLFHSKSDFGLQKSKSQDKYNRNKINKDQVPKNSIPNIQQDQISREAIRYVSKEFKDNYGNIEDKILYPFTRKQSVKWLKSFLIDKFINFGKYQDAIDLDNPFLFHSVISPMLNIGLLTDTIVVRELVNFLYKSKVKIPIQSLEGFIRQVIGWRNYTYMIYTLEPNTLYKENQLNHNNKISKAFWDGNTGVEVIDKHIQILNETSYLNHIQRLMVIGNFMLLLQLDPIQVLNWFTTMFIDSSDCLMVPNIIMSQFNTPIMMSRIYISSFNYIQQMSNVKYSKHDQEVWNTLFNAFLLKHKKLGLSSYVYAATTKKLISLPKSQQTTIKHNASIIISQLTKQS